jgi:alpha-1,6-mannosyltransferase
MNFLDINSMYCPRGGGIRTFHHAKIEWFAQHPEHNYSFVYPGRRARGERLHDNVHLFEAYGPPIGNGYRLLVDFRAAWKVLRDVRPEVLEVGDPLSTVAFSRLARRLGRHRGLLTALWHSDPYETWLEPRLLAGGRLARIRGAAAQAISSVWYRRFRAFDLNVSTSMAVEERLQSFGVPNVVRLPLGIDDVFFDDTPRPTDRAAANGGQAAWGPRRPLELLYAGRLDPDKGFDLVLALLPRLLEDPRLRITIAGRGARQQAVEEMRHARFRYLGYVANRREVAEIYRRHHVLLSPGPHETFGLSALEAMACGLVVVGTNVGGVGEFLRRVESPFRFTPGDVEGFCRAILAACDADLAEHARRARELAAQYGTWEDAIGRLLGCYMEQARRRLPAERTGPPRPHAAWSGSSGAITSHSDSSERQKRRR